MLTILTEREFKNLFCETVASYIEEVQNPNKCLTDSFAELARAAASHCSLPWTHSTLELAGFFEVWRCSPELSEKVLNDACKLYAEYHYNNLQANLPLEQ